MHKPDSTTQVHLYYFNDICKLTSVLKSIKTPQATDNVTAFSKKHSRKKKKREEKIHTMQHLYPIVHLWGGRN